MNSGRRHPPQRPHLGCPSLCSADFHAEQLGLHPGRCWPQTWGTWIAPEPAELGQWPEVMSYPQPPARFVRSVLLQVEGTRPSQ